VRVTASWTARLSALAWYWKNEVVEWRASPYSVVSWPSGLRESLSRALSVLMSGSFIPPEDSMAMRRHRPARHELRGRTHSDVEVLECVAVREEMSICRGGGATAASGALACSTSRI